MRCKSLVAAAAAVFISGAVYAQGWSEYVNRDDFFMINFPGDPARTETTYRTAKGTQLPAHVYTAQDSRGTYRLTVVDYNSAPAELATAMDEAATAMRRKGTAKYDAVNMLDNHRSWRMTIEIPGQRVILAEILTAMNNRLYISEAETALNLPPPAQFQASLQVLNDEGVRIRYREVQPATADEIVPVTARANQIESARVSALIAGNWRNPTGGTCEAAYFKAGERTKTKRNEEAMIGTVVNAGMTVTGQLIIAGAREGQFINPTTDRAIFLFDPQPGKLSFSAVGEPVLGWPDVTLESCSGNRG